MHASAPGPIGLILLLLPVAALAQAPERTPPPFGAESRLADHWHAGFGLTAALDESATRRSGGIGEPLTGAVVGLPAGVLAGAGLGYLIGPREDGGDACMWLCVPTGPALGAVIGAAVGPGIGAHLMNGRDGNVWVTTAGSVIGMIGGIGVGYLFSEAADSRGVGVAVAIPIMVGLPALAAWVTGR